jgi:hypothetical protein
MSDTPDTLTAMTARLRAGALKRGYVDLADLAHHWPVADIQRLGPLAALEAWTPADAAQDLSQRLRDPSLVALLARTRDRAASLAREAARGAALGALAALPWTLLAVTVLHHTGGHM